MIVQVEKFMRKWNMVPEGGRVLVGAWNSWRRE